MLLHWWHRHKIPIDARGQSILETHMEDKISWGVNWHVVQKSNKCVENLCQLYTHLMDALRIAVPQEILLRHHEKRSNGEYSSALNTTAMEINCISTIPRMMGMSKNWAKSVKRVACESWLCKSRRCFLFVCTNLPTFTVDAKSPVNVGGKQCREMWWTGSIAAPLGGGTHCNPQLGNLQYCAYVRS